jgi:hypothetical protein
VPAPPPAVAPAPAPPAVFPAPAPPDGYVSYAPDYYVWDGYEYVGLSGGQYVYWSGAGWLIAPPVMLGRFHGWERYHPDWRRHAVHYHPGPHPYHYYH